MDFSIVIPALNEKTRLPPFLLALAKKLKYYILERGYYG